MIFAAISGRSTPGYPGVGVAGFFLFLRQRRKDFDRIVARCEIGKRESAVSAGSRWRVGARKHGEQANEETAKRLIRIPIEESARYGCGGIQFHVVLRKCAGLEDHRFLRSGWSVARFVDPEDCKRRVAFNRHAELILPVLIGCGPRVGVGPQTSAGDGLAREGIGHTPREDGVGQRLGNAADSEKHQCCAVRDHRLAL